MHACRLWADASLASQMEWRGWVIFETDTERNGKSIERSERIRAAPRRGSLTRSPARGALVFALCANARGVEASR